MTNKKYNPFKMLGGYIGAVIIVIIMNITGVFENTLRMILFLPANEGYPLNSMIVWITIIIGFLIGWAIHSLVRRLRK